MRLSPDIKTTIELRKRTYLALKRMRQLEKGRQAAKLYIPQVGTDPNDLYILRCLGHLKQLIDFSCAEFEDSGVANKIEKLDSKIDKLTAAIRARLARDNKTLKRGTVGAVLLAHTSLFKLLLRRAYSVRIETTEWANFSASAVAVWGDAIAPKARE